jgi:hypothetical protein
MLAVALACLVVGSGVEGHKLWRLSGYYAARARKHENIAKRMRIRPEPGRFNIQADHHDYIALKYELAARYPWLPVGPYPPEPRPLLELLHNKDIPGLP